MFWTPRALIFTRHFDIIDLVDVFRDYILCWSLEFLFPFILYLSFVLQLVIRVCTPCFESRPYCLVILHDVLSFHLVILLFS